MTEDARPEAPAVTRGELAEALDGFWLNVASGGQRVHGQVANPDEVASVLLATLGRIAAERPPGEPAPPVAAALDRPEPLAMPQDEHAALKRSCRLLANIVARYSLVLEAARIEMLQNGPHAGMQWILNSLPDLWDDDENAWDGQEPARSWFDRTDAAYRAAGRAVEEPASDDTGRDPTTALADAQDDTGASPDEAAPGRVQGDTAKARTLITSALLAELGRRLNEYENAINWNTDCTRCAAALDSSYAETARREQAERKLAEVRETVTTFLAHYGHSISASFKVAADLAHGVQQVLDRGEEVCPGGC